LLFSPDGVRSTIVLEDELPEIKRYRVSGIVNNLTAPYILPSDRMHYLEFGFTTVGDRSIHNCVFYIRFADPSGPEMCGKVARALASKGRINVLFSSPPEWDGISEPSYVIDGVEEIGP
jgi:hypothetical protein